MKSYTTEINGSFTIVRLSGSLDAVGSVDIEPDLRKIARSGENIAIDQSDVTFITSQGVRLLVITAKIVNAKNKILVLIGPKPPISKVLSVMGIDKLIKIYESANHIEAVKQE